MKNILLFVLINLMYFQMISFGQSNNSKDYFNVIIRQVEGDLNNDGKIDQAIVEMDTTDETRPLRLQVFLSQSNGKLRLEVASTKIIEPQYPLEKLGEYNGYQIPNFFIENGILTMWSEIKSGNIAYDFKYQNSNFELISITRITNNATKGYVDEYTLFTEMKFNLITGVRIETDGKLGSDEIVNERKEKKMIRPLPKLQDFNFSDKNLY